MRSATFGRQWYTFTSPGTTRAPTPESQASPAAAAAAAAAGAPIASWCCCCCLLDAGPATLPPAARFYCTCLSIAHHCPAAVRRAENTARMWADPSFTCSRPCSTEADRFTCASPAGYSSAIGRQQQQRLFQPRQGWKSLTALVAQQGFQLLPLSPPPAGAATAFTCRACSSRTRTASARTVCCSRTSSACRLPLHYVACTAAALPWLPCQVHPAAALPGAQAPVASLLLPLLRLPPQSRLHATFLVPSLALTPPCCSPDDSASLGGAAVDEQGWTARGMKAGSVVREVRVHGTFYQVNALSELGGSRVGAGLLGGLWQGISRCAAR